MAGRDIERLVNRGEARLRAMHDPEPDRLWEPSSAAVAVAVVVPIFGIAGMGLLAWLSEFSGPKIAVSCAFALVPTAMMGSGVAGYFSKARFQDGPAYTRLGCTGRVVLATIGLALFAAVYVLVPIFFPL